MKDIVAKLKDRDVELDAVRQLVRELRERLSPYYIPSACPGKPQLDDLGKVVRLLQFLDNDLSPRDVSIPPTRPTAEAIKVALPGNRASARSHAESALKIVQARLAAGRLVVSG